MAGSGFESTVVIAPRSVSFSRIEVMEGAVKATAVGYYDTVLRWNGIVHPPTPRWLKYGLPAAALALLVTWLTLTPDGLLGKMDAIGCAVCHRIEERSFFLADRFPGAEILSASDGEEAWSLLRSRKPLLAVLDISMPRATGIEVVQRMRADERLRAVPAILLTSKVISMEDVRAIEA
ncbi:MAG: response regulator, partial [Cellulomonadaceae bacterium]|nr:response regulator [Cellulomonadaceae bacterium]